MESVQTQSTRDIVMNFLTALQERNIEKIVPLFSDLVDWFIPGAEHLAPWLGRRSTKAEIKAFFELLWSQTQPISGNIDNLAIVDNVALTSGTFSTLMLKNGKVFNSIFFTEITVEDNEIVRYRLLEEGYGLLKTLTA